MLDPDQRRQLGAFVRAHRERLPPEGTGRRRRTPGLRREELAARAGISVTWCAWIEQGREVQASPATLGRVAGALSLSPPERAYLFGLAGCLDPDAASEPAASAPASLVDAVSALGVPAYGLDRLWNACCWNAAAARLFRGWLDADHQRNLLRFVFLSPLAQALIPEWQDRARRLLAEFRADYGQRFRDSRVRDFVDQLRDDSRLFSEAWNAQDVQHRAGGPRSFNHPEDGRLTFVQHTFAPSDRPDYKLVVLMPEPSHEPRPDDITRPDEP